MTTLTLPRAHDPYAHRWHGRTLTVKDGDTAIIDSGDGSLPERVYIHDTQIGTLLGWSFSAFALRDSITGGQAGLAYRDGRVVCVACVGDVATLRVLDVSDDWQSPATKLTAAVAKLVRSMLEPVEVAPPQHLRRTLGKGTCAILRRVFGCDLDIVRAARVSYDGDRVERLPADDRKLLRYLMQHRHTSPFEQVALVFEVRAPLYVVQQLLRHRTAKVNQQSGRYTELACDVELVDAAEWRTQSTTNKQGSGDVLALEVGEGLSALEYEASLAAVRAYQAMIAQGVAREQARRVLPASTYTRLVWQCDLHNLLHFLGLRLAPGAQLEMRRLAAQMAEAVARHFPWTWQAWLDLAAPAAVREMVATGA